VARAGIILALGFQLGCSAPDVAPRVNGAAPDVTTLTLAGDTVQLSSFRGRPLLLNLWATWCLPCRKETPYLQSLYEARASEGLEVVGLTLDQRSFEPEIREFIEEFGVTYTILRDPDMVSMDRYAVLGLPATFLVNREGTITWAKSGPVEAGERAFEAALDELLQ
jgi:peroxiredoxin